MKLMTLNLWVGHSLIAGNIPVDKVPLSKYNPIPEHYKADVESFGIFDNSSANYNTFYPDINPEDLLPKDGEFVFPTFRLLSNVVVNRNSSPVEFPEDVLKASMKLMVGQTVYPDHEQTTANAIGVVVDVFWQEAYKDGKNKIPAGMNGILKIDGKANPRIARGVMMDPPSIHSNSVTVSFTWEKSHPEMDNNEFMNKLGTYDKKGNLIRRIANKIIAYHETSLVPHGADPYAKKIGEDNHIVLPEYAFIKDQKLKSIDFRSERSVSDYKTLEEIPGSEMLSLPASTLVHLSLQDTNPKNPKNMKDVLTFLAIQLAIKSEELNEENYQEMVKTALAVLQEKTTTAETQIATLQGELATANTTIETLTTDKAGLQETINTHVSAKLTEIRDGAKKYYKLAFGEKAEDAILANIDNATEEAAAALLSQYKTTVEEKMPLTCQDCGSVKVSRKSSTENPPKTDEDEFEDLQDKVHQPKKHIWSEPAKK